ncbi:MAG: catalase family protein [Ktedonobacteraceae bacterium]
MTNKAASKQYSRDWQEVYSGGSPEAEARQFAAFAQQIKRIQAQLKQREHAPIIRRAFHAKIHVGITDTVGIANAEFRVLPGISEELRVGIFQPSATYQAAVRFSSASGAIQPDATKDLRGVALRVMTDQGNVHDFLMTDAPASHARNARQFMVAADAMASRWKIISLLKLLIGLGLTESWRMVQALMKESRKIDSLATDQFWSRAPYRFGPYAVKFSLQPTGNAPRGSASSDENYLKEDFIQRLLRGPITFDFKLQCYVSETKTPIEDGTVEWKESDAPFETIAQLIIPQQDLRTTSAKETELLVDNLAFNPWNTTDEFRPLGNLNRARRTVYQASADYRSGRTDLADSASNTRLSRMFWIALIVAMVGTGLIYLNRHNRKFH